MLHLGIASVLFDRKAEGVCTARLVRALTDRYKISLYTSGKADTTFVHENLEYLVEGHQPRDPRWFFNALASIREEIPNNFYLWGKRVTGRTSRWGIPDIFYSRAWPHASLVAGYQLAHRYGRPLILHFSDPFPPPTESLAGQRFMRDLQKMVDSASVLSFTNKETVRYQKKFLEFDEERAFVLNHVAPPPLYFGEPKKKTDFYYIGSVGPHRPVDALLAGFKQYRAQDPDARLYFVGASQRYLKQAMSELGLSDGVTVLPFTKDVSRVLAQSGVLVSIDADVSPAVFTPTKIVEYLFVDRPIMAITPSGSPVASLLRRSPETTVVVNTYTPDAIAQGFQLAAEKNYDHALYQRRFEQFSDFSANSVAHQFDRMVDFVLKDS